MCCDSRSVAAAAASLAATTLAVAAVATTPVSVAAAAAARVAIARAVVLSATAFAGSPGSIAITALIVSVTAVAIAAFAGVSLSAPTTLVAITRVAAASIVVVLVALVRLAPVVVSSVRARVITPVVVVVLVVAAAPIIVAALAIRLKARTGAGAVIVAAPLVTVVAVSIAVARGRVRGGQRWRRRASILRTVGLAWSLARHVLGARLGDHDGGLASARARVAEIEAGALSKADEARSIGGTRLQRAAVDAAVLALAACGGEALGRRLLRALFTQRRSAAVLDGVPAQQVGATDLHDPVVAALLLGQTRHRATRLEAGVAVRGRGAQLDLKPA